MRIQLLVISLLVSLLAQPSLAGWGCRPASVEPGNTATGCVKIDGVKRHYRLHVPTGYHGAQVLPLFIGLHGGGGKAKRFERYSRFSDVSERTGKFMVVYPEGINKHWNDGRPKVNADVDDIAFLQHLVMHLQQQLALAIDVDRIFLVGMSNGGLMALRLACEQPDWVAGAGIVAASMSTQIAQTCPEKPVPVAMVFVFGDQDSSFLSTRLQVNPLKPTQVRGQHIGIRPTVERWAAINHCGAAERSAPLDAIKNDRTKVVVERFVACQKPVVFYHIQGGGHRWPDPNAKNGFVLRKALNLGSASHEIHTAEAMWGIFQHVQR